MNDPDSGTTHFGYQTVASADKAGRVRGVFDSVASRYDLMNDLMSGGLHRLWKRFALTKTGLRPGGRALDVAGGTGDLAAGLHAQVGERGVVCLTDINAKMLEQGRQSLLNRGICQGIWAFQADAENLPVTDHSFDCVTCGFGLRNVTNKGRALASMRRALRPGGRTVILEFSKPAHKFIEPLYDAYSFAALPALGALVANDAQSYRYLAESIRMHPDQQTLAGMMTDAGFDDVSYFNLTGGIVAVHVGFHY